VTQFRPSLIIYLSSTLSSISYYFRIQEFPSNQICKTVGKILFLNYSDPHRCTSH